MSVLFLVGALAWSTGSQERATRGAGGSGTCAISSTQRAPSGDNGFSRALESSRPDRDAWFDHPFAAHEVGALVEWKTVAV